MQPTPPPDPLDSLLDQWGRGAPSSPGPLAPEVWRRIARMEEPVKRTFWEMVHGAFARPSFAAAFVAACVLLGLFLAEARRSRLQSEYNRELMQSYLRLIDPLLESADRTSSTVETGAKS
ncbi:hypothetical protein CMV30_08050 [Nibricoccus aquaticus]|uniref:Uncharacterized protein n=1 Tax=Nibricoccus aquaticus TaxID=2576891 RepID=A0A290Q5F2_9BACT|nr:hypothetical protein [Nibricoccus aquaticus]ATC63905.1 hypothetical protein CMV30_08050 [Nibricoccus aquaticus]